MFAVFILFVCCVNLSFAQYPLPGNATCADFCPGIQADLNSLNGIWYLVRDIAPFFTVGATCSYMNVTGANFEQVQIIDGIKYVSYGVVIQNGSSVSVKIDNAKTNLTFHVPLTLVSVTADSMAFASCLDCGFFSKNGSGVYASVYTRLQFPSCNRVVSNVAAVGACGIPPEAFTEVDHSSCQQECPASSFSSSAPASVISRYVSGSAPI